MLPKGLLQSSCGHLWKISLGSLVDLGEMLSSQHIGVILLEIVFVMGGVEQIGQIGDQ